MPGKPGDGVEIASIVSWLRHTCGIPDRLIKPEHYLLCMEGGPVVGVFRHVTPNVLPDRTVLHRPDITVLCRDGSSIRLVIELDGRAHDLPGLDRGRTGRRDRNYRRHNIPFCVINKRRFRRARASWFPFLARELRRHPR